MRGASDSAATDRDVTRVAGASAGTRSAGAAAASASQAMHYHRARTPPRAAQLSNSAAGTFLIGLRTATRTVADGQRARTQRARTDVADALRVDEPERVVAPDEGGGGERRGGAAPGAGRGGRAGGGVEHEDRRGEHHADEARRREERADRLDARAVDHPHALALRQRPLPQRVRRGAARGR